MALAVLKGSFGSRGGGWRAVLTEQNLHPRVHVSPISYVQHRTWEECQQLIACRVIESVSQVVLCVTMMVAVAVAYSPPPQHSPMFGHRASSHTCESRTGWIWMRKNQHVSTQDTLRLINMLTCEKYPLFSLNMCKTFEDKKNKTCLPHASGLAWRVSQPGPLSIVYLQCAGSGFSVCSSVGCSFSQWGSPSWAKGEVAACLSSSREKHWM